MFHITLRLKLQGDFNKFTADHPGVSLFYWCNFNYDFYELKCLKSEELELAIRFFLTSTRKSGSSLRTKIAAGDDSSIFVMKCCHRKKETIGEIVQKFNCLPIMPYITNQGWSIVNAVCLDQKQLSPMLFRLGKLGETKVGARRSIGPELVNEYLMVPIGNLTSTLTEKQAESLLTAVDLGYYQVPRKTKFEEIAKSAKVSKATYEEHVRKAENKIITAAAPYLSLFFGRTSTRQS